MNINSKLVNYRIILFSNETIKGNQSLSNTIFDALKELFPGEPQNHQFIMNVFGNPIINPDSLKLSNDRINCLIVQNHIEFSFYRRQNDNETFDAEILYQKARLAAEIICRATNILFNRLAINIGKVVSGIDTLLIKKKGHCFLKTIPSFSNSELNEWNTRVVRTEDVLLNNKNDSLNVIYSANNNRLISTYEDVVVYQIDINTTHLNMNPRFGYNEIVDFLNLASKLSAKMDSEIEGLISNNE